MQCGTISQWPTRSSCAKFGNIVLDIRGNFELRLHNHQNLQGPLTDKLWFVHNWIGEAPTCYETDFEQFGANLNLGLACQLLIQSTQRFKNNTVLQSTVIHVVSVSKKNIYDKTSQNVLVKLLFTNCSTGATRISYVQILKMMVFYSINYVFLHLCKFVSPMSFQFQCLWMTEGANVCSFGTSDLIFPSPVQCICGATHHHPVYKVIYFGSSNALSN